MIDQENIWIYSIKLNNPQKRRKIRECSWILRKQGLLKIIMSARRYLFKRFKINYPVQEIMAGGNLWLRKWARSIRIIRFQRIHRHIRKRLSLCWYLNLDRENQMGRRMLKANETNPINYTHKPHQISTHVWRKQLLKEASSSRSKPSRSLGIVKISLCPSTRSILCQTEGNLSWNR